MKPSRYYLGIDGGQSSTKALIGDEHCNILGRSVAGPCNHVSSVEAAAKFRRVIESCVAGACESAQIDPAAITFSAVCLGLSGGPEDKEALIRMIVRSERYKVTHDAEIALSGALAHQAGIIAIAGTGSMVFGRSESEQTARSGGWGYVFGDEGSAFDLVRRSLRAVLKEEEGWGPPTELSPRLFEATSSASGNDLLHLFYTAPWPRDRIARLAPVVSQAAEAGDAVALNILANASDDLAEFVAGLHAHLFTGPVPVAPIGGVFKSAIYRTLFATSVTRLTGCSVIDPKGEPAMGALREAIALDVVHTER